MIDAYASHAHYVDHLHPIWAALPEDARGVFTTTGRGKERADQLGIWTTEALTPEPRLTLVAAHSDYRTVFEQHARPVAYVNHGVGQSWRDAQGRLIPSGVGEPRPGVRLFLTPGPHATNVTREANGPTACIVQVGSPKLEQLRALPPPTTPLLVVSTHWDQRLLPETRTALPHYLTALTTSPTPVALHSHPKFHAYVRPQATRLGLEYIETFTEVCQRATVYATDASSTLYEFAALDRPVVVLNSPHYRRSRHHGLRFWDAADVGVQVNHPDELPAAVVKAVLDHPPQQRARAKALSLAYHSFDGHAARRATTALLTERRTGT